MTVPAPPVVSVIVPTVGRPTVLDGLRALTGDTHPEPVEYLVVLDGAPAEDADRIRAAAIPGLRLIERAERAGRAAACNAGLAAARGRYVVLLDDDMRPDRGFVAAHLAVHRAAEAVGRRVGVIGAAPAWAPQGAPPVARYLAARFDRHLTKLAAGGPFSFRDVYTGNFSVRRAELDAIGGFDERFRAYGNEDGELAIRLRDAGIELVYAADAVARQTFDKDIQAALADAEGKGRTAVLLASLHPADRDQLAFARQGSRARRAARGSLQWIANRPGGVARLAGGFARLERAVTLPTEAYALALDAAYRAGVQAARRSFGDPQRPPGGHPEGSRSAVGRLGRLARSLVARVASDPARRRRLRRMARPAILGTLRRTSPLSDTWGTDRGLPIDRRFIEAFLAEHREVIRGRILEVGDDRYARRYGRAAERIEVLDIDPLNPRATLVGDLATGHGVPRSAFDCCIVTQVLQYVPDLSAAVRALHESLVPGGVLLVTIPAVSRIGRRERLPDLWRVTGDGARQLFEPVFGAGAVEVRTFGNVLTGIAFLAGLAAEDLEPRELDEHDPAYPVLVAVRARRSPE